MKHITIIGSALSGNKGAAAMLESAVQTLDSTDTKFTLLSMYPKADRKQNFYKNLDIVDASPLQLGVVINSLALAYRILPFLRPIIRSKSPAIRALLEADVLLDQGGITFVDGREKFLLYNIASILPALNLKIPVVKCAQALGPFNNPINRLAAKIFLPKMKVIVSRGKITHGYLETLHLTNIVEGADYAFLLELTKKESSQAKAMFDDGVLKHKKVVGVSPSVVMQKKVESAGGDYTKQIVDFVDYLTKEKYAVILVPHSVRSNTDKTHNNDLPLCSEIYEKLKRKNQVLFLDKELTSQQLRYWIGRCDYFVASRFHAMISSLSMQVPTLVIGWSHKYREVLAMFGLEEFAFGTNNLTLQQLKDKFSQLVNEDKAIKKKLKAKHQAVKNLSSKQVDAIKSIIAGKSPI